MNRGWTYKPWYLHEHTDPRMLVYLRWIPWIILRESRRARHIPSYITYTGYSGRLVAMFEMNTFAIELLPDSIRPESELYTVSDVILDVEKGHIYTNSSAYWARDESRGIKGRHFLVHDHVVRAALYGNPEAIEQTMNTFLPTAEHENNVQNDTYWKTNGFTVIVGDGDVTIDCFAHYYELYTVRVVRVADLSLHTGYKLCVAGDEHPLCRKHTVEKALACTWAPHYLRYPSVHVGEGTVVWDTVERAGAEIGKHCRIMDNCVVGHGAVVGDYVNMRPGAIVGAGATVGECVEIGENAQVLGGAQVPRGVTIPPGNTWGRNGLVPSFDLWAEVRSLRMMLEMHPDFGTEVRRCATEWKAAAAEQIENTRETQ